MDLAKRALKYGAVLVGVYLAVEYAHSGTVPVLGKLNAGADNTIHALQGR